DLLGAVPESAPALFFSRPTEALILGSLSLYQPGLLDILPMYCFFVLLSPIALEILYRWKWITLLGISFAVWIVAQTEVMTYIEHSLQSLAPVNFGSFDILAWQLPFFAGFTFGHLWVERPESSFHFPPSLVLLCFVLTGLGWAFKNDYLSLQQLGISLWDFADKTRLAPLRLLNFITLTYLIAFINTYRPKFFVSRALAFLGQHSLAVFTFQAIFVSVLLTQPVLSSTFAHRTLTALATVGSLFFFAWLHELWINWRTQQKPIEATARLAPNINHSA
ncbi:MAG TPA: OpgC domain-containing protein, partial [Opitutaceae bacterium]|nr:OpgC domain-containing protein [Opitutaceae bacterium]